jgi:hypothetical protein
MSNDALLLFDGTNGGGADVMQICLIFGHLWSTNDTLLRKRLLLLLHQHGTTLASVRDHLASLLFDIADGDDPGRVRCLPPLSFFTRAFAATLLG